MRKDLSPAEHPLAAISPLGAKSSASLGLARLLVELTNSNFLLNAAAFHQLAESAHGLLCCLSFAKCKLNHRCFELLTGNCVPC